MISNYNLKLGYKIWLEFENENTENPVIGERKIELLKNIDETGSIQKASESIGLDFKKAHEILNDLQDSFWVEKLFTTERGRQGGTNLSLLARTIIDLYANLQSIIDPVFSKLNHCLSNDNHDIHECLEGIKVH